MAAVGRPWLAGLKGRLRRAVCFVLGGLSPLGAAGAAERLVLEGLYGRPREAVCFGRAGASVLGLAGSEPCEPPRRAVCFLPEDGGSLAVADGLVVVEAFFAVAALLLGVALVALVALVTLVTFVVLVVLAFFAAGAVGSA